ncbi:MAG: amidohydrolase family protein [Sulfurospirillaceae bacterium]|nr:amidohydrolase family protein [Sulfurospirillaceae bacterium]MDD2826239.1 amidohydrolase family protein [Sulfurospirillaceae bacterium]
MIIKNAILPTKQGLIQTDVLIQEGKIISLKPEIVAENEQVIDATGLYILPGIVDLNVRFANSILNQEHIDKLASSCLAGGVTTAVVMADFSPRLDSATLLELVKFKIDQAKIDIKMSAPLADQKEDQLNNIATLLNNGAAAILADSYRNANLLRRGMQYSIMKNKPIFCNCYEPNLDDNGLVNEGIISSKLGLSGISKISETAEVAKVCELALCFKANVVLNSLSTKRSLDIAQGYKNLNTALYAEVSIHHLCKNDTLCDGFNTYAKIMPPLRDEDERQALLLGLKEGSIDILTSAHAPKSILYKDVAFEDAEFGIGSIEEFLPLCYTHLVKDGIIDFEDLMNMCSATPAHILGLETKGRIGVGFDADIVLFDPNEETIIKNKNSLYQGDTLFGKVKKVIVAGKEI